jgi:CRISPR-associated protein Csb2
MSLTIGIRFLTGYCAAARSKSDPTPEWPPHPARLFMALAAAHFECESGDGERDALAWLESLDPPAIQFGDDATSSEATPTFVPMNDSRAVGKGGTIQTVPALKRHRAERLFPRTHLPEDQDCVFLSWLNASVEQLKQHRSSIAKLCDCVGRLGHSSSLVQVWVAEDGTDHLPTYVPTSEPSKLSVRVVSRTSGTLDRLAKAFLTPPYRAEIKSSQSYRRKLISGSAPAITIFDDRLMLFKIVSANPSFQWLQLETTLALTRTLREAIIARCPEPVPESISGHAKDGSASASPHIAFLPLPFVGQRYADGHLLGVAIALSRDISEADRKQLGKAIDAIADVPQDKSEGAGLGFDAARFPGLGQWRLVQQGIFDAIAVNLRVDTWTASSQPCRQWASVTPVVFDQHGKSRSKAAYLDECAQSVRDSVSRVVLGATAQQVKVAAISSVRGVPSAREFPRLKRKDGSERRHMHVEIHFDRPVVGPLLIGAGRYRGYGLCRPILEGKNNE